MLKFCLLWIGDASLHDAVANGLIERRIVEPRTTTADFAQRFRPSLQRRQFQAPVSTPDFGSDDAGKVTDSRWALNRKRYLRVRCGRILFGMDGILEGCPAFARLL